MPDFFIYKMISLLLIHLSPLIFNLLLAQELSGILDIQKNQRDIGVFHVHEFHISVFSQLWTKKHFIFVYVYTFSDC